MARRNDLLDAWIGQPVLVETLAGSTESGNRFERLLVDPSAAEFSDLQACAQVVELVAYDSLGIVLRQRRENAGRFFVPWLAVLNIEGTDPDVTPEE